MLNKWLDKLGYNVIAYQSVEYLQKIEAWTKIVNFTIDNLDNYLLKFQLFIFKKSLAIPYLFTDFMDGGLNILYRVASLLKQLSEAFKLSVCLLDKDLILEPQGCVTR